MEPSLRRRPDTSIVEDFGKADPKGVSASSDALMIAPPGAMDTRAIARNTPRTVTYVLERYSGHVTSFEASRWQRNKKKYKTYISWENSLQDDFVGLGTGAASVKDPVSTLVAAPRPPPAPGW